MNIRTALLQGQQLLEKTGIAAPRLTAEVLLMHAVGCERAWLYAHPDDELRELWWIHYGRYLHERLKGKPTQYITGKQEFYGRDFRVTPDVLIPRPETEHSIEAALQHARDAKTICDIGTGSGAIAVTLALEMKTPVIATDVSEPALQVAAANAHRLAASVNFACCDLGSALRAGAFDLVVSNPPYVPAASKENVQREVRDHEPEIALFGGPDGLDVYRRLIPDAWRLLRPGGLLILEIGALMEEPMRGLLACWRDIRINTDLAGLPRVAIASKPAI
jgi:release factor glutamine methyltransferase